MLGNEQPQARRAGGCCCKAGGWWVCRKPSGIQADACMGRSGADAAQACALVGKIEARVTAHVHVWRGAAATAADGPLGEALRAALRPAAGSSS